MCPAGGYGPRAARLTRTDAQTHDLLAPIYGWVTEGFDTLGLKTLLNDLARVRRNADGVQAVTMPAGNAARQQSDVTRNHLWIMQRRLAQR